MARASNRERRRRQKPTGPTIAPTTETNLLPTIAGIDGVAEPEPAAPPRATGPRTAAGKQRSSRNAWRHGLRSSQIVLPGEDADEFDDLRDDLRASHRPIGDDEEELVERIAVACWKRRRAEIAEADILTMIFSGDDAASSRPPTAFTAWAAEIGPDAALKRVERYQRTASGDYHRALLQLQRNQRARERAEREAAEAEAAVRRVNGDHHGLKLRELAAVLLAAWRQAVQRAYGFEPVAPMLMPDPAVAAPSSATGSFGRPANPDQWPSPEWLDATTARPCGTRTTK